MLLTSPQLAQLGRGAELPIGKCGTFISNERNDARRTNPNELLRKLESFNGECASCGHPCSGPGGWDEIDHVQPVSYGGTGQPRQPPPVLLSMQQRKAPPP